MKSKLMILILFLLFSVYSFAQNVEPETKSFTIIPGDNFTAFDVKVEWLLDEDNDPNTYPLGYLNFIGPKTRLEKCDIAQDLHAHFKAGNVYQEMEIYSYIDGVSFKIFISNVLSKDSNKAIAALINETRMSFSIQRQGSHPPLTGAPASFEVVVSASEPITLDNQVQIVVKGYPGSEAKNTPFIAGTNYALKVKEGDSNLGVISLLRNSAKEFGRFRIFVASFTSSTLTAQIRITVHEDFSIRGGNTYLQNPITIEEGTTLGKFISRLSEAFQFQVEWLPLEGHPESVEYYQQMLISISSISPKPTALASYPLYKNNENLSDTYFYNNHSLDYSPEGKGLLKDTVEEFIRFFNPQPKAIWLDQQHLQIDTSPYQEVLRRKEEELRQKEIQEKEKQEQEKLAQEKQQELEIFTKKFQEEYQLSTIAYPLRNITPVTAKTLIDPHLFYYLVIKKENNQEYYLTILEEGKHISIVSAKDRIKAGLKIFQQDGIVRPSSDPIPDIVYRSHQMIIEESVADERSNSLIITAIPRTHQKVKELLAKIDQSPSTNQSRPIRQYQVEIVLLTGAQKDQRDIVDAKTMAEVLEQYGLKQEDLGLFEFQTIRELGKSIIPLVAEKGDIGTAQIALTGDYSCQLEFLDIREPYLVLRGTLKSRVGEPATEPGSAKEGAKAAEKTLLKNTLFLEPGKPTLLGLTNLNEALILLLRLREEKEQDQIQQYKIER